MTKKSKGKPACVAEKADRIVNIPNSLPRNLPEFNEYPGTALPPIPFTQEYLLTAPVEEIGQHVEHIFERHAKGEQLNDILAEYGYNRWRLRNLLIANPHLYPRYNLCRDVHAEALLDQALHIADETVQDTSIDVRGNQVANNEWINRSRLRVDTRKWKYAMYLNNKLLHLENGGDLKAKASYITRLMMSNNLSPEQSKQLLDALNTEAKINEVYDLAVRIGALEDKAKALSK